MDAALLENLLSQPLAFSEAHNVPVFLELTLTLTLT